MNEYENRDKGGILLNTTVSKLVQLDKELAMSRSLYESKTPVVVGRVTKLDQTLFIDDGTAVFKVG
jgi:hypothetical protein